MTGAALYVRVSTGQQSLDAQRQALQDWAKARPELRPFTWYTDTATGRDMDRPGWRAMMDAVVAGKIGVIAVTAIDRIGRTAAGLHKFFEDCRLHGVRLISLRESLDLSTAPGRLMGAVIAGIAAFETEIRGERVRQGQEAARRRGKRWGGSRKGRRTRATLSHIQDDTAWCLAQAGVPKSEIARTLGVSRPTIYAALKRRVPLLFDKEDVKTLRRLRAQDLPSRGAEIAVALGRA